MAIEMTCPSCDKGYSLADSQLGKKVRCKGCDETFVVEEPRRARRGRDDDDRDRDDRPGRRGRDDDDDRGRDDRGRPYRGRDRDDEDDRDRDRDRGRGRDWDRDDDDDGRPKPRRRSGGGSWLPLILGIGGGVLALVLIIVVVLFATGGLGSRVTKENFAKVKSGMTEAELTAILGTPRDAGKDAEDKLDALGGIAGMFGKKVPAIPRLGGFGIKVLEWRSGNNVIQAHIQNGKAAQLMGVFVNNGKAEWEMK